MNRFFANASWIIACSVYSLNAVNSLSAKSQAEALGSSIVAMFFYAVGVTLALIALHSKEAKERAIKIPAWIGITLNIVPLGMMLGMLIAAIATKAQSA